VAPVPHTSVTILTGFLGSGKTTLLNRALRDPAATRTAVVINEFGEVGIDHALVTTSDDTIMVLENGCLCCTVFGDLVATLNRLYHAREAGEIPRFDRVVIETSGLADPAPVLQAFLSDPTLAGLYRVGAVVAVVDAVNGPGTLDAHIEAARQAALADHILITKRDLLAAERAETIAAALAARLRRLNPAARIVWSASGL
jgi:G3E family GTPase